MRVCKYNEVVSIGGVDCPSSVSGGLRLCRAPSEPCTSAWFNHSRFTHKKNTLASVLFMWWTGVDSNHRKLSWQIYSLLPLATREPVHTYLFSESSWQWSRRRDLNLQPTDYKSVALPIELLRHTKKGINPFF